MKGIVIAFCFASSVARVFSSERIYFETDFTDAIGLRPLPPTPPQPPLAGITNRTNPVELPSSQAVLPPRLASQHPAAAPPPPVEDVAPYFPVGRFERTFAHLTLNLATMFNDGRDVLVFSPLSVTGALSLLMAGASGKTLEELSTFLGTQPGNADGYGEISQYLAKIGGEPVGGTLRFASGIFFQKGTPVSRDFVTSVEQYFPVNVMEIDFRYSGNHAVENINKWVYNRTEGILSEILSQPPPPDTTAIFLNVIYFEGEWEFPFSSNLVRWSNFYVSPTETVQVELMPQLAPAYLHEDKMKGYKVLGIPYKNSDLAMYFILPTKTTLDTFLSGLTEDDLIDMIDKTTRQEVIYTVPKMKLVSTLELREPLKKLGLESLFSLAPDLRNIAEGLRVDSVLQKVEVQITETGTKAAASTMVSTTRSGRPLVRLDKPFAFLLYHPKLRAIYFWGTVHKPTPHLNPSRSNFKLLRKLKKP